jgi:hypothetical protein
MDYKDLKAKVHELIEQDPYAKGEDDHANLMAITDVMAEYFIQLEKGEE